MSSPTHKSWEKMVRVGRYLKGRPRLRVWYKFQEEPDGVTTHSDTDWAGCVRTRKSTSGGCVMMGGHSVKAWSATQASVALSSGEAEYYGVVRATGVGLGVQALLRDAGVHMPVRVWTDSSAAMGTAGRQGLGKMRHLECHSLWLQQRLRRKELQFLKIPGESNPADLSTKHIEGARKLDDLIRMFNCRVSTGRAEAAPQLKRAKAATSGSELATGALSLGTEEQATTVSRQCALPHLRGRSFIERCECAVPESEQYGEPDATPAHELADPVPALTRQPSFPRQRTLVQQQSRRRRRRHGMGSATAMCDDGSRGGVGSMCLITTEQIQPDDDDGELHQPAPSGPPPVRNIHSKLGVPRDAVEAAWTQADRWRSSLSVLMRACVAADLR